MKKRVIIKAAGPDQIIQSDELMGANLKIQNEIFRLVAENEHLRDELEKDPKGVLKRELGIEFSDDIRINMINQKDNDTVSYIAPMPPKDFVQFVKKLDKENEISKSTLEKIQSGEFTFSPGSENYIPEDEQSRIMAMVALSAIPTAGAMVKECAKQMAEIELGQVS